MRTRLARIQMSTVLVVVAVVVTVVAAVVSILARRADAVALDSGQERWVAAVFLVTIVVGELNRITLPGARESAPMSVAAGYALAMSTDAQGVSLTLGPEVCVCVTAAAMLVAALIQLRRGVGPRLTEAAIRLLSIAFAAVLFRWVPVQDGRALADLDWASHRWLLAIVMVVVSAMALTVASVLTGLVDALDKGVHWASAVRDELGEAFGLSSALAGSGALIALAEGALGVVAVPVFLLPIVLTQFALRRYLGIRATYRQTIRTLSRLTEVGGYTRPEHPNRVADLTVSMGRLLGVPARDISTLEYAALLHDIGQLSLSNPIPGGATMLAAPADQDAIARDGAEIVRTTGVLVEVANLLELQAKPYRHVRELGETIPLGARIIKVANAFDDLAGEQATPGADAAALERLHLGLGYEYDPAVVEALERVLDLRRDGAGALPVAEPTPL